MLKVFRSKQCRGLNPRPGLRRWVAKSTAHFETQKWKEAWASIHYDGAVTLSSAVGAQRCGCRDHHKGNHVPSSAVEYAVSDFMALLRANAKATDNAEYELRVGIAWAGQELLQLLAKDDTGFANEDLPISLHSFTPVEMSVDARSPLGDFHMRTRELTRDYINQGGIECLQVFKNPAPDSTLGLQSIRRQQRCELEEGQGGYSPLAG